jgi:hypothetical protein
MVCNVKLKKTHLDLVLILTPLGSLGLKLKSFLSTKKEVFFAESIFF